MGLDMYLYLERYESLSNWDNKLSQEKIDSFYPQELKELRKDLFEYNFLSKTTKYQVAYWRKENAIHKWFVDNCADGIDECQDVYVPLEKLEELVEVCEEVLNNQSSAEDKLPTQSGFFFGSQKYDEWYYKGLQYTVNTLKKVIEVMKTNSKYECYYHASW